MSTPNGPRRLLLGSCPDSWGVWFADDPLQTPWHRFLDELAAVGTPISSSARTGTCPPTRRGSATRWAGAG